MKNGLIEFRVSNFCSFRDEAILSMEATSLNDLEENLIIDGKNRIFKTAEIFGANASGKSNIIKALTSAILFIRNSHLLQINNIIPGMIPFKFSDESANKPCLFSFSFIADEIKYNYSFSADMNKVYSECLEIYKTSKPTLIFKRTSPKDITVGPNYRDLEKLKPNNLPNKLFLSTATSLNYESTKAPFLWFANSINTFSFFDIGSFNDEILKNVNENKETKEFLLNLLNKGDISISDYNVNIIHRNFSDDEKRFFPLNEGVFNDIREIKIDTIHKINNKNYKLVFDEESEGSKKLFCIGILLQDILNNGLTMIIDELERSLHPHLVKYLIEMFLSKEKNPNNAQLIFTTHSEGLLDLDLFRRDQIYFVDKNEKNSNSELFSLVDFSVRKGENIEKAYMNGRYGAVPFIKD